MKELYLLFSQSALFAVILSMVITATNIVYVDNAKTKKVSNLLLFVAVLGVGATIFLASFQSGLVEESYFYNVCLAWALYFALFVLLFLDEKPVVARQNAIATGIFVVLGIVYMLSKRQT